MALDIGYYLTRVIVLLLFVENNSAEFCKHKRQVSYNSSEVELKNDGSMEAHVIKYVPNKFWQ